MSSLFNGNNWIFKLMLLASTGIIISLVEWLIYRRLLPRFERKQYLWRRSFLRALHAPLQIYIWLMVASFVIATVLVHFNINGSFVSALPMARQIITLLFVFWFAMRFMRILERGMVAQARTGNGKVNDQTSVHAISQLIRITVISIVLLMILQTIGIKMSALLAFGGVGAAAIGFAAKDTIGNFIGGMMIYWDRPFSVGDWVRSPDRDIEGTVEEIGWRLTRIRTFDKRPLYVPNGILSNISLENPSRMTNRRIKMTLGVRYDDASKIADIANQVETMLREHPEIDSNQTAFVNLFEFGPSSLNILVYTFTKTTEWVKFQAIQQDVLLKIMNIVAEHNAECAFPTQTVHVPEAVLVQQESGGFVSESQNNRGINA